MARALMSQPKLLLLDEPSLGLAPIVCQTIFSTIDEIKAEGTTVLLVEQNANAALKHSDRGYVLETGAGDSWRAAPRRSPAIPACGKPTWASSYWRPAVGRECFCADLYRLVRCFTTRRPSAAARRTTMPRVTSVKLSLTIGTLPKTKPAPMQIVTQPMPPEML